MESVGLIEFDDLESKSIGGDNSIGFSNYNFNEKLSKGMATYECKMEELEILLQDGEWLQMLDAAMGLINYFHEEIPDSLKECVENFDIEEFEDWNEKTKGKHDKWKQRPISDSLVYLLKKFKLKSIYQLSKQHWDLIRGAWMRPVFKSNPRIMAVEALRELNVHIELCKFPMSVHEQFQMRKQVMKKVPMFAPTTSQLHDKSCMLMLMNCIQDVVNDLAIDLMRCQLIVNMICGVYVVYIKSSLQIIYLGSTHDLVERKLSHKYEFENDRSDGGKCKELYQFMKDNSLTFDDVEFMPIMETIEGFEILFEAEFYDKMKPNDAFSLTNSQRPIDEMYNIDSMTTIYRIDDFKRDKVQLYVGSSNDPFRRFVAHLRDCFNKINKSKYDKELYKYVRTINENKWEYPRIRFIPIELCPIWIRFQRETHWIDHYDLVQNGFNTMNVMFSEKAVEQKRLNHNEICKKYREANRDKINEKISCPLGCGKLIGKSSISTHKKTCTGTPKKQLTEEEKALRRKEPVLCPLGCGKMIKKNNMSQHKKICKGTSETQLTAEEKALRRKELVPCPFGCGKNISRANMSTHKKICKSKPSSSD